MSQFLSYLKIQPFEVSSSIGSKPEKNTQDIVWFQVPSDLPTCSLDSGLCRNDDKWDIQSVIVVASTVALVLIIIIVIVAMSHNYRYNNGCCIFDVFAKILVSVPA